MRNGIFGLLVAIVLTAAVSMGLSMQPGAVAEWIIDFLIAASVVLALVAMIFKSREAFVASFLALACIGAAWGGHAATRESRGNARAAVGAEPVLVRFQATLEEPFRQPDPPEDDLLDRFQNAADPPRHRAPATLDHFRSGDVVIPCSGTVSLTIDGEGADFAAGDVVAGVGWMRGIGAPSNPGEPDFRVRAFRDDRCGSISVVGVPELVSKATESSHPFLKWRSLACEWVDRNLIASMTATAPARIRTLVVAMTTGRQLPGYRLLRQSFSASGLSHFLAISGFNVAVLFGAVWVIMEFIRVPWLIRGWILATTALLFLFVVDVETSVLRAGIAGVLAGVSVACDRGWRADGLLATAAIFTLAGDPWAAWNPGFQLSYGAVLALRYGSGPTLQWLALPWKALPGLPRTPAPGPVKSLATALSASAAAWLMSTPITESHFGSVSPWAAPASTVLAPLAAVITVLSSLACLAGSIPGASILLGCPLSLFASIFLWLAEMVARLPSANFRGGLIPWWWAVAELVALAACWMCPLASIRRIALPLFAFLLVTAMVFPLPVVNASPRGWKLRLITISVGDGSAHVIETPSSRVLFDAGTISRHAGGSMVLVPALKALGCTHFDAVIISHPHLDHFSALPEIAAEIPIDRVYATEAFIKYTGSPYAPGVLIDAMRERGVRVETLVAGSGLEFDGFAWSVLHPAAGYQSRIVNDGSLAFRIHPAEDEGDMSSKSSPSMAWLTLLGDAQTEAIANLLASPQFGPSRVMELPHHGAWADGVAELMARLNPEMLVQSTGPQRFRHDKIGAVVGARLRGVTCRDGALRVTWFGDGIKDRILLERWRGSGWEAVTPSMNRK
ncbi:MAG: ComEC/Rec2 family competence protein [Planctomycetes bacterium]|nr:ComEC/Rec2 family competence protein [Planctomycetota bacterium]